MDEVQKKLVKMLKEHPDCIADRKTLRALLLDYLPQNKLKQNLILNAYDEAIVDQLQTSSDVALRALQMVKALADGYGITKNSAVWAVASWCHMMGLGEIADVITTMILTDGNASATNNASQPTSTGEGYRTEIGLGRYAAGYDIPDGVITVSPIERIKEGTIEVVTIVSGKENTIGYFKDSFTVELKKGEYLKTNLVCSGGVYPDYRFSISKRT